MCKLFFLGSAFGYTTALMAAHISSSYKTYVARLPSRQSRARLAESMSLSMLEMSLMSKSASAKSGSVMLVMC
jgi:hypothetical protein